VWSISAQKRQLIRRDRSLFDWYHFGRREKFLLLKSFREPQADNDFE